MNETKIAMDTNGKIDLASLSMNNKPPQNTFVEYQKDEQIQKGTEKQVNFGSVNDNSSDQHSIQQQAKNTNPFAKVSNDLVKKNTVAPGSTTNGFETTKTIQSAKRANPFANSNRNAQTGPRLKKINS